MEWTTVLAIASAIVLLVNAAEKIATVFKVAKAPERKQDDEIANIKDRLSKVESKLERDKLAIADSKECNHVLTKGMLALLEHGINGNNIDQMKDAKNDVNTYLINH